MQPVFFRINQAIRFTLEYYQLERIKNQMLRFAGKGYTTQKFLDEWVELIFKLHDDMEAEINQTIHTSNHNTQVYMFENLKEWLADWRIESLNIDLIKNVIDDYNEKTYSEFVLKVENEVEKLRASPNFINRDHLEEYEIETKGLSLMGGIYHNYLPFKTTVKNYKFYCINEKPELIDTFYIPEYLKIISPIIENFRRILNKYVSLYDAGKIVSSTDIIIEKQLLENNPPQTLLNSTIESNQKLKVNLSVSQLAYLFKMLSDIEPPIFDIKTKVELQKFIIKNFETAKTKGKEISAKKLANLFSNPPVKDAKAWIKILREMIDQASNQ